MNTTHPVHPTEVIVAITEGSYDEYIDLLRECVIARHNYLAEQQGIQNKMTMSSGSRVRTCGNLRPKYLLGIVGTVSSTPPNRRGDIMVDIDPMYYRRLGRYGRKLSVPATCLELVA